MQNQTDPHPCADVEAVEGGGGDVKVEFEY